MFMTTFQSLIVCGVMMAASHAQETAAPSRLSFDAATTDSLKHMAAVSKLADIEDTIERLRQQLRNIEDSQAVETEVPADAATGDALSDALRVQRRSSNTNSIGWQPLRKRKLAWQPLKKRSERIIEDHIEEPAVNSDLPKFVIRLRDAKPLRAQLMSVVEQHLLDDLTAAEQYGIKPENILADLRNRQSDS